MRMRFKPYARAELLAADFHIHDPFHLQGQWHQQFARPQQPLVLELGCGKGGFISQLAAAHPENNYLGIDITDKVLILAKRAPSSPPRTRSAGSISISATPGAKTPPPTSTG